MAAIVNVPQGLEKYHYDIPEETLVITTTATAYKTCEFKIPAGAMMVNVEFECESINGVVGVDLLDNVGNSKNNLASVAYKNEKILLNIIRTGGLLVNGAANTLPYPYNLSGELRFRLKGSVINTSSVATITLKGRCLIVKGPMIEVVT